MKQSFTAIQINNFCSLIDEIVSKSEWVIIKSTETYPDGSFELAAILQIRQISDYADAIAILIKNSSSDTTLPLIRSILEISVGLEYLLETDFENRAKKFLFYYYKKREIDLLKGKKGAPENKIFIENLLKDKYISEDFINSIFDDAELETKLISVQELLKGDLYIELDKYYNEVKLDRKRYWYSLLDGPKSFKQLVESLQLHSRYAISYNIWSGHTHGWDIVNKNLVFEGGGAKIISKRNPLNSDQNALETIFILRKALMSYIKSRLKNEIPIFTKWLIDYKLKIDEVFYSNEK